MCYAQSLKPDIYFILTRHLFVESNEEGTEKYNMADVDHIGANSIDWSRPFYCRAPECFLLSHNNRRSSDDFLGMANIQVVNLPPSGSTAPDSAYPKVL